MRVELAPNGVKGVDTILPFGEARAKAIKAAGYDFAVRYLGKMTALERDVILRAGLGLLAVTISRRPSWHPSGELGDLDGIDAVANAERAGLLPGMTLFCDLEGPGGVGADTIEYVNAWASRVQAAQYKAGLYVGYGIQLNDEQMYHALKVTAYWDSCSRNVGVAHRGFQMVQHYPGNQKVAGIIVDINHIQTDGKGDTPSWLIGDP